MRGLASRTNDAPLKPTVRVRPVLAKSGGGRAKAKRPRAALGDITNQRQVVDGNTAKKHDTGNESKEKYLKSKKLVQAAPQSCVTSAASSLAEQGDDLCAPLEFCHGSFALGAFEDDLGVDGLAADVSVLANQSASEFLSQASVLSPMKHDADCCATFDLADLDGVNFDDFEL